MSVLHGRADEKNCPVTGSLWIHGPFHPEQLHRLGAATQDVVALVRELFGEMLLSSAFRALRPYVRTTDTGRGACIGPFFVSLGRLSPKQPNHGHLRMLKSK